MSLRGKNVLRSFKILTLTAGPFWCSNTRLSGSSALYQLNLSYFSTLDAMALIQSNNSAFSGVKEVLACLLGS